MPMLHKQRYLGAMNLPVHMRPPVCLRYAMWTMAASISDKYSHYQDILYERARRYLEAAEMKIRASIKLGCRMLNEVYRAAAKVLSQSNMRKHGH
jgi:phytoene/squalene synthetase